MRFFIFFLAATAILQTKAASASPSEKSYFMIELSGNDAENLKHTPAITDQLTYGENNQHQMQNWYLSLNKDTSDEIHFSLRLECQQRTLNYSSPKAEVLAPTCHFSIRQKIGSLEQFTSIEVTSDVSPKLIKNFSWHQFANKRGFYFGCWNSSQNGCPNIAVHTDKNGITTGRISYFRP